MSKGKKWFIIMSALAILSLVSFFQINSYFADKHKINGLFTLLGIILAAGAVLSLIFGVLKNTNNDYN
jgi:uncharacterized membrane-anchored protein